jgi:AraC family transcriptional regulator
MTDLADVKKDLTLASSQAFAKDAFDGSRDPTRHLLSNPQSANISIVAQLLSDALATFDTDCSKARRCIERAHLVIHGRYGSASLEKGMLADWQMHKAVHHIHSNIGSPLRMEQAAKSVNLSSSYFSRAFKGTTGISYSEFVIQARISLAKHLLVSMTIPISEVALMCGLSDQPHLTRLFRRVVGLPPSMWRRRVLDQSVAFRKAA